MWGKLVRLDRRVRASRFDVALDLQGLIKSGILTAYTGARLRIGFGPGRCAEWANCLFTNRHVTPPPEAVHVVDQYLALLEPLGVPPATPEFHIPARPAAERRPLPIRRPAAPKRDGCRKMRCALRAGSGSRARPWC